MIEEARNFRYRWMWDFISLYKVASVLDFGILGVLNLLTRMTPYSRMIEQIKRCGF